MCLLVFAWRVHPRYRLIVAANRDEFHERPTAPLGPWPQPVDILDRTFHGFVDLRLLRCEGMPFDEQDLLAAHRASAFIAKMTGLAAALAADGADIEITSFDPRWHWAKIAS